jgi:hypothetical protein
LFFVFLLFSYNCFSQSSKNIDDTTYLPSPSIKWAGPDIPRPKPQIDTFHFRYDFCIGDTLIYVVQSKDSIIINYGTPLLKIRFEKIMLTCDSITPEGHFVIKQQLIEFKARESYMEEKNIDRSTTTWLNVPVYIEIDSMGYRYKQYNKDSLTLAISPGGTFQPFILLPLNCKDSLTGKYNNKKYTNESWIINDSNYVVENGMPMPVYRYVLYYRMMGMVDTLDLGKLLKITFSMTSQSSHKVNTSDVKMLTTSINNAGGEVFWDTINWVPKYYIHTIEQRLTIEDKIDNNKQPGFHYIYSTFLLDKFIRKKN